MNKTILKPRNASLQRRAFNTYAWDFSDILKFRIAVHMISEKGIWFQHPDYNPDWAQKLISSSMSRRLSTCNISSKSMHAFLSNLANRQTFAGKRIYLLLCRSKYNILGDFLIYSISHSRFLSTRWHHFILHSWWRWSRQMYLQQNAPVSAKNHGNQLVILKVQAIKEMLSPFRPTLSLRIRSFIQ